MASYSGKDGRGRKANINFTISEMDEIALKK